MVYDVYMWIPCRILNVCAEAHCYRTKRRWMRSLLMYAGTCRCAGWGRTVNFPGFEEGFAQAQGSQAVLLLVWLWWWLAEDRHSEAGWCQSALLPNSSRLVLQTIDFARQTYSLTNEVSFPSKPHQHLVHSATRKICFCRVIGSNMKNTKYLWPTLSFTKRKKYSFVFLLCHDAERYFSAV